MGMSITTAAVVRLQNAWFRARDDESGQGLVEYALIIAIVSLGAVLALGFLSGKINSLFSKAGNSVNKVTSPGLP
jgi:pilus assembly protein Flp/PilA